MVSYERKAVSQASPEAVFAVWTNVEGWTDLDQMQSASINGPFRIGATIRSKAKGFPASTLTVTRVEPPGLWVDVSRAPGLRMTFDHVVESDPKGTVLTERVTMTGPLARVVGPLMRRKLEALFAATTSHLAAQAEVAGPT
jgi:Polyketide cyclase / dehydrase and lipid transport